MFEMTRSEAINVARLQYQVLAERARAVAEDQVDYIDRLVLDWDQELERLAGFGRGIAARPEVVDAVIRLVERLSAETVTADVLLGWIDAFPDAVADLFPPSAATYRLVEAPASRQSAAGNRQPALALAA